MIKNFSARFRTLAMAGAALTMLATAGCDSIKDATQDASSNDQSTISTTDDVGTAANDKSRVDGEMGGTKMHDEMTNKEHAREGMEKGKMGEDHMKMGPGKMPSGTAPADPPKDPPMDMPMKDDM